MNAYERLRAVTCAAPCAVTCAGQSTRIQSHRSELREQQTVSQDFFWRRKLLASLSSSRNKPKYNKYSVENSPNIIDSLFRNSQRATCGKKCAR